MPATALKAKPPPDLPPPYTLVTLRETGDAFAHACRIAAEAGAGTLVHVGRFDVTEFALVLEPEEPLVRARRVFFAGMAALADAIGAVAPPGRPVVFDWPDTILFDGARIGGGRLGWPADCAEGTVPPWLVFSASLIRARIGVLEGGAAPASTSLEEEQFAAGSDAILEGFARFLMVALDTWHEKGFGPVAASYLARLTLPGDARLDEAGDLVIGGEAEAPLRLPLVPALEDPAWLDRQTGAPKV
jgi:Biotin/lipoate A/B protein ligase family